MAEEIFLILNGSDRLRLMKKVANNCTSENVYIDDVSVIPYYKINYDANGGTGDVTADYFESGTYTDLDDGSTLSMDGAEFAGWSLTKGGTAVSSVTAAAGEDITLYAVWLFVPYNYIDASIGLAAPVPGEAPQLAVSGTGYTGTVTWSPAVDGTFAPATNYTAAVTLTPETGYTAFGISENGYNVPGAAKVINDAEALTFTAVYSNAFPGINTWTGTTEAYTFDDAKISNFYTGGGLEEATKTYDIPAAHRMPSGAPLYTYFVVSDPHLGGVAENIDYFYMQWESDRPTRATALGNGTETGDVFKKGEDNKPEVDFVVVNGDLVNYGHDETKYRDILDSYIEQRLNIHGIPVFLTNGNHEFYNENSTVGGFAADRLISSITGQVDYIEANYGDTVEIIRDETNPDALCYAADMYGAKYIFMSTPEMSDDKTSAAYTVSEKQLKFVEDQLFDGENSGKTNYIMTHLSLYDITNGEAVEALLEKHPDTVVFVSHTHNNLSFDTHYTVAGDMTSSFTYSDTGATSYLSTGVSGKYETSFTTGQLVEVYSDKVLIKARRFADESKFFGHALYLVDTPDEGADFEVSISGTLTDGETLSVLVNGEVPADGEYTYEWTVGGTAVSTEKTYTFTFSEENVGEYVHLRVTAADGSFASCNSVTPIVNKPETLNVASIKTSLPQGMHMSGTAVIIQKSSRLMKQRRCSPKQRLQTSPPRVTASP